MVFLRLSTRDTYLNVVIKQKTNQIQAVSKIKYEITKYFKGKVEKMYTKRWIVELLFENELK